MCRELPRAENLLSLIELKQTFPGATHPQVLVLVLKDVVDIRSREVMLSSAALHSLQCLATLRDDEQSAPRSTDINISGMVDHGYPHRYVGTNSGKVKTSIRELCRNIVIAQYAISAHSEESPGIGTEECHNRPIR